MLSMGGLSLRIFPTLPPGLATYLSDALLEIYGLLSSFILGLLLSRTQYVHDDALYQHKNHKQEGHDQIPVDSLGITHAWKSRINGAQKEHYSEKCRDAQSYPATHVLLVQPEHDPADCDHKDVWDINLIDVVTNASLKGEADNNLRVVSCGVKLEEFS